MGTLEKANQGPRETVGGSNTPPKTHKQTKTREQMKDRDFLRGPSKTRRERRQDLSQ